MKSFKHRSWNHICWNFQSKTGLNRIFLNGELEGTFVSDSEFVKNGIVGSETVLEYAFIVGQEPDPPSTKGGFESEQAFVGDITELNMWNYTLEESTIKSLGNCETFEKGNIIPWSIKNFEINNVKIEEKSNLEDICKPVEDLLVFPKKMSWNTAWTICLSHGGYIQTPQNDEENNKFIETLKPYKTSCADPVSGNIAWLGIKSMNFNWYKLKDRKNFSSQSFTNWKVSAPYYENYDCGFIKADGIWDSDIICSKKMKLCTVCKISGKQKSNLSLEMNEVSVRAPSFDTQRNL